MPLEIRKKAVHSKFSVGTGTGTGTLAQRMGGT
jgi:hypothetical protein